MGDTMEFTINKIVKDDFLKINEEDVMFITNPGRMGDEDGITFIVNKNNEFKIYRVSGWMYKDNTINEKEFISLNDAIKQFPKWYETWKNYNNKKYKGKYKHLYMGFGNGLSIDISIYKEFKPYLDREVDKYLEDEDDKKALQYAAIFNSWEKAFINMLNARVK